MKGGVSMLAERPYKLTTEYNNNKMKYIREGPLWKMKKADLNQRSKKLS